MADLRLQGCSAARIHKSQRMAAPLPQYAGAVKNMQGAVKKMMESLSDG